MFYKKISFTPLAGVFPPLKDASPDGLLAYGGDLSPGLLLTAYVSGIFPWYSEDSPILWWSPNPRCILYPTKFHISDRSARKIRNSNFRVTFNQAFKSVISRCSSLRKQEGTWILPEMVKAYCILHELGYAQSIEVWQQDELVGGLYGVCMERAFFGESMFHTVTEASRCALQALVMEAREKGFLFLDCQQKTPHMIAVGAETLEREHFVRLLQKALWE